MSEQVKFQVPYPEYHIFKKKRGESQNSLLPPGARLIFELDRVEYPKEGGILTYKKGWLYPTRGFVYPEAVYAINLAKAVFMEPIRLIGTWVGKVIGLGIVLQPFRYKIKTIEKLISMSTSIIWGQVENHVLDESRLTPSAREFQVFLSTFLKNLGFIDELSLNHFPTIISAIVEYDNVYRFRLEDLASETTKSLLLTNPQREIQRIIEIYQSREENDVVKRELVMLLKSFKLLLYVPRIKKAFTQTLSQITFENFQYDAIEVYNSLLMAGYKYSGKSFDERVIEWNSIHGKNPPKALTID